MAFDPSGNLYVCNEGTNSILKISPAGVVSPFASGFTNPEEIVYYSNNLYVSNVNGNSISKISLAGVATILTTTAILSEPRGLAFDASGFLYVANNGSGIITKINITTGTSSTFAALNINEDSGPFALKFDATGNLLVGSYDSLYRITPGGIVKGLIASYKFVYGLYVDNAGVIYGVAIELYKLTAYFNNFLSINNSGDLVLAPNPIYVSGGSSAINGNITTNGNAITIGNATISGDDTIKGNLIANAGIIANGSIIANTNLNVSGATSTNSLTVSSTTSTNSLTVNNATSTNSLTVNGTAAINQIDIGNSGLITALQSGILNINSNGTQIKQVTLTFPVSFSSTNYQIVATPINATGATDVFAISIHNKTTSNCIVQVYRVDGTSWGQNLNLDWVAIASQ
jgi:hypothetical protein